MLKSLFATPIDKTFPEGTIEELWSFHVTGTLVDGTAFDQTVQSTTLTATMDIPAGTGYVLVVSKNGVSSLPSDPVDISGGTIVLSVPDATQKAVLS